MEKSDNLKEVYLNDSYLDEVTTKSTFRLRKIALPAFPKWSVIIYSEVQKLLLRMIFGTVRSFNSYVKNHPSHAIYTIVSVLILTITLKEADKLDAEIRNKEISDQTLSNIAMLSVFSRNYENQVENPGAPIWAQKEAVRAIIITARKAGLSLHHQAVLLATAEVESGFNPLAKAKSSSACGLFQFINSTGQKYGLTLENCSDPWINAQAGVSHYLENYNKNISHKVASFRGLEKTFKIFELSYYLHHDGQYSSNPDDSVKAVVLKGTHFLIQAHRELKNEKNRASNYESFNTKLANTILTYLQSVKTTLANLTS